MNTDRTGPEKKLCPICNQEGLPPEIMPYLKVQGTGHVWMHPICKYSMQQAKNAKAGPLFPELHEPNDGQ